MKKGLRWALFVLVVAALWLGAVFLQQSTQVTPYASNSTESNGVKALYLLLERLEFDVGRKTVPFGRFDGEVLVAISPDVIHWNAEELRALERWIYEGRVLVLFGDYEGFSERMMAAAPQGEMVMLPEMPASAVSGALLGYGRGSIRVYNDASILANDYLRVYPEAASMLIQMVWDLRGKTIYFEEYQRQSTPVAAGLAGQDEAVTLSSLIPPAVQALSLQLLLALVLGLWLVGKRPGAPLPPPRQTSAVRQSSEGVEALAALMDKGDMALEAVMIQYRRLLRELAPGYSGGEEPGIDQLRAGWQARGGGDPGVLDRLYASMQRAQENGEVSPNQAVGLAQEIETLHRRVRRRDKIQDGLVAE